jgi:hypothetical protein
MIMYIITSADPKVIMHQKARTARKGGTSVAVGDGIAIAHRAASFGSNLVRPGSRTRIAPRPAR